MAVRIIVDETLPDDVDMVTVYCKSLDTKPTSDRFANGSVCIEVDTGDAYMYDEEGAEWNKIGGGDS